MTDDEALRARRLGYWLRLSRERADMTLSTAAQAAGLSAGSGSTVSRWEDGSRPIKLVHLERLAAAYGVSVDFLRSAQMTDEERLDAAVHEGSALEQFDAEREAAQPRQAGDVPAAGPHRRTA